VQKSADRTPHTDRASKRRALEDLMELVNRLRAFVVAEDGQDLLEYALLVALIALVAVGAITAAGTSVNSIFTQIGAKLATAAG
jgi:pilus assembly protein Flp/PilA